jgi:hypothetical protein
VPATKTDGYQVLWFKITITPTATGACCNPSGTCTTSSQTGCTGIIGGTYQGDNVACGSVPCTQPHTGACCHLDGTCTIASSYACTDYSGAWQGTGTTCAAGTCPGVIGSGDSGKYTPYHSGAQQGGVFFDVTAGNHDITVTRIDTYCAQAYNNATPTMEFLVYNRTPMAGASGSCVGFEGDASNPGGNGIPPTNPDSTPAWTLNTDAAGLETPGLWLTTAIPLANPVTIPAHQTRGFWVAAAGGGIGWLSGGNEDFTGADGVTMHAEHGKLYALSQAPAWAVPLYAITLNEGVMQASFNGRVYYSIAIPPCYANCDNSTTPPVLNVGDFTCFLQKYAQGCP